MATPDKVFKNGEPLFLEGEPSKSLFLIKKGFVSIRRRKGHGYVELGRVGQNEVMGEMAFFDRTPRSASAIAVGNVEATEISFEAMEKVWKTIPDFLKTIIAAIAERLRKANDQLKRLQAAVDDEELGAKALVEIEQAKEKKE